jgi:16S rRNA (guanine527-N7)-methyltransferase
VRPDALAQILTVPRETLEPIERLVELVRRENDRQNLVARSTLDSIWARHVYDSAQLLRWAPGAGSWLDLGSGAGFPGLVIAALTEAPVTLVEARPLRVAFLREAAAAMGLRSTVEIVGGRVETLPHRSYGAITARAFAPLPRLLALAHRFSESATCWVLPKGRSAPAELEAIVGTWQGDFRVEPSVTDPAAGIIVATNVRPGRQRR